MSDRPAYLIEQPIGPNQVQAIECSKCKALIHVDFPIARVVNTEYMTQIVFLHERAEICPKCRTPHVPVLKGFGEDGNLSWEWVAVARGSSPSGSRVVVPPPTGKPQ